MKPIFVRPARLPQEENLIQAFAKTNSAWDAKIIPYSYIWCAFAGNQPIAYMPVQRPLMMEAIAFHPASNDLDRARAMQELTQNLVSHAYEMGIAEIYFLGSHQNTIELASNHGFQLIDSMPLYRMRLIDLEQDGGANGT